MSFGHSRVEGRRPRKALRDLKQIRLKTPRVLCFEPGDNNEQYIHDLPNDSFDLIICLHIIENLNDAGILAQFRRILAASGILVVWLSFGDGSGKYYEDGLVTAEPNGPQLSLGTTDNIGINIETFRRFVIDEGFRVDSFTMVDYDTMEFVLTSTENISIYST